MYLIVSMCLSIHYKVKFKQTLLAASLLKILKLDRI